MYKYSQTDTIWILKVKALWKGFWLYGSYMGIGMVESGQYLLVWLNHSYKGSN